MVMEGAACWARGEVTGWSWRCNVAKGTITPNERAGALHAVTHLMIFGKLRWGRQSYLKMTAKTGSRH